MGWLVLVLPLLLRLMWTDLTRRCISNVDVLLLMVLGACAAVADVSPLQVALFEAASGATVAFAVLLPFYLLRWMGAGDVKLGAALGVWLGLPLLLPVWVVSVGLAIVYGTVAQGPFWRKSFEGVEAPAGRSRRVVPYGAALCAAAMLVVWTQLRS